MAEAQNNEKNVIVSETIKVGQYCKCEEWSNLMCNNEFNDLSWD